MGAGLRGLDRRRRHRAASTNSPPTAGSGLVAGERRHPAPPAAGPVRRPGAGWLDRLDARLQRHRATAVRVGRARQVVRRRGRAAGQPGGLLGLPGRLPAAAGPADPGRGAAGGPHGPPSRRSSTPRSASSPRSGRSCAAHVNGLTGQSAVFLVVVLLWLVYGCLRLSRNAQVLMADGVGRAPRGPAHVLAVAAPGRRIPRHPRRRLRRRRRPRRGRQLRRPRTGLGPGGLRRFAGRQRGHVLGRIRHRPLRARPGPHAVAGGPGGRRRLDGAPVRGHPAGDPRAAALPDPLRDVRQRSSSWSGGSGSGRC